MDQPGRASATPLAAVRNLIPYRPYGILKLLYTALSIGTLSVVFIAGLSPAEILELIARVLETITRDLQPWSFRQIELFDLLGILGFMLFVIRVMEPAMFTGYVTKHWYLMCILLFSRYLANSIHAGIEACYFVLQAAGLFQMYDRPHALAAYAIGYSLISIVYLELSSRLDLSQLLQAPAVSESNIATDGVQLSTPAVSGHYPEEPNPPSLSSDPQPLKRKFQYQPSIEEVQDDGPHHVGGVSKFSVLSPTIVLRPALKRSRPRRIQTKLLTTPAAAAMTKFGSETSNDSQSSGLAPESPWSPIPLLLLKLLQGQRSPNQIPSLARKLSLPPNPHRPSPTEVIRWRIPFEADARVGHGTQDHEPAILEAERSDDEHRSEAMQSLKDLWTRLGAFWMEYSILRKIGGTSGGRDELKRLSEAIESQVLLALYQIEIHGDVAAKSQQRYLLSRTQRLLDVIDSPNKRNPEYGEKLEQIPATYKICPTLQKANRQCKAWIKTPPKPKEVSRGPSKMAIVCADVYWTSEFIDSLTDLSDEAVARLPSGLFDETGPLLSDLCRSLRTLLRVLAKYPNVLPIHSTALPYAINSQRRMDELRKRADAAIPSRKDGTPESGTRTGPQGRRFRILDNPEDVSGVISCAKYRRLNGTAPEGPATPSNSKPQLSGSSRGTQGDGSPRSSPIPVDTPMFE